MKKLLRLTLLIPGLFILACGPAKKSVQANDNWRLPELPLSEVDIPVSIAAAPLLEKAEKLVPQEFTSDKWPAFLQPTCDFRYKYRFVRGRLQLTCHRNIVTLSFGGNYQVAGSKSLCTGNIPVTPWISGACGFPPQPLRRVKMALLSSIQFQPGFQVRTTTTVLQVQPLDRCEVSVFSSDITQMIMDSIRSSLSGYAAIADKSIAAIAFPALLKQLRDSAYGGIGLRGYGYLLVNPAAFRIGQLELERDSFRIHIGVSFRPEFSSSRGKAASVPASLPALTQTGDHRPGIRLFFNASYDYVFLTQLLRDSLHNKVFTVNNRTLLVKDARLSSAGGGKLRLQVDFSGSNHGSLILTGTPVVDTVRQTLSMPDVRYSLEGADLALRIGKTLFGGKVRRTIQGKTYLDLAALVKAAKPLVDHYLNLSPKPGLVPKGNFSDARLRYISAGNDRLYLQASVNAAWELAAGNL